MILKNKQLLIVLLCTIATALGIKKFIFQKTTEQKQTIFFEASELVKARLHKTLNEKSPIIAMAGLAILFANDPNNKKELNFFIQHWVKHGGNINQEINAQDGYLLFVTPEAYDQLDEELKQQKQTLLSAFAGLSTVIEALLANGAKVITTETNALTAWAEQYIATKDDDNQDFNIMQHDALSFLLKATTKTDQDIFFKKYGYCITYKK